MDAVPCQTVHASCVALKTGPLGWTGLVRAGVLLLGPSACGKSDLALRLIDRGGRLIADDRVVLSQRGRYLFARPPASLRGLIEVRGVGVVPAPSKRRARLALAVKLVHGVSVERLPDPVGRFEHGTASLPMIEIDPFHASAVAKIERALAAAPRLAQRSEPARPAMLGAPT